jgi:tRNA(Ser,Leu) C12 N-acetylase TAN1
MRDWNVVISVQGRGGYRAALDLLRGFGHVEKTEFYNVLVAQVAAPGDWLEAVRQRLEQDESWRLALSRVTPVTRTFVFQTADEFRQKAAEACREWAAGLAGKHFYVRMHRRGFKGRLSSQAEEQALDAALLDVLRAEGRTAEIGFQDPDAVIALETVGNRAGLSLWSRQELLRYPFLGLQ